MTIYYADKKYCMLDGKLFLDNQLINFEHPIVVRDSRIYVAIEEWNEKVLGKQLSLHENYIVLSMKGMDISGEFWSLMDKYFMDFTGKYGKLEMTYSFEDGERLCGLSDQDGNVVIKHKYQDLHYIQDKPIIAKAFINNKSNNVCMLMSEDEETLFRNNDMLRWIQNEPLSLSNDGGFGGERPKGRAYDITGECMDLRVEEDLIYSQSGNSPACSAYINGLQSRLESSGKWQLVNRSNNVLFEATLMDGLRFPTREAGTEIIIQNDCLIIYDESGNAWGTLDLEGNTQQFLVPNL